MLRPYIISDRFLQPLLGRPRRGRHKMVERSMPSPETGRRGDRAMDEVEPVGHGLLERAAECETRGDCGRQRAAGPVRRRRVDPLVREPAYRAFERSEEHTSELQS